MRISAAKKELYDRIVQHHIDARSNYNLETYLRVNWNNLTTFFPDLLQTLGCASPFMVARIMAIHRNRSSLEIEESTFNVSVQSTGNSVMDFHDEDGRRVIIARDGNMATIHSRTNGGIRETLVQEDSSGRLVDMIFENFNAGFRDAIED